MSRRRLWGRSLFWVMCVVTVAGLVAAATQTQRGGAPQAKRKESSGGETLPLRELYPAGTTKLSASGPGAVQAGVQCDSNGNVYLNSVPTAQLAYEYAREGLGVPLTKLSLDSGETTTFAYPALSDYGRLYGQGFYVTPRGGVYALVQACPHQGGCRPPHFPTNLIVRYNADGSVDSVVKLQSPSGVHVLASRFAAFLDGNIVVSGLVLGEPPRYYPSKPFTGVFDAGGAYVGPLVLANDVAPPRQIPSAVSVKSGKAGRPPAAGQAGAPQPGSLWVVDVTGTLTVGALDGTIYLMRATTPMRLYVISSTGEVLAERLVKPPKPGMRPLQASLAGNGRLLIEFSQAATPQNPRFHNAFALVDPQTGKVLEAYNVPSDAGIPACMDEQNELLFLKSSKSGRLEVAKYMAE